MNGANDIFGNCNDPIAKPYIEIFIKIKCYQNITCKEQNNKIIKIDNLNAIPLSTQQDATLNSKRVQ